jgi:hypothetical protein
VLRITNGHVSRVKGSLVLGQRYFYVWIHRCVLELGITNDHVSRITSLLEFDHWYFDV